MWGGGKGRGWGLGGMGRLAWAASLCGLEVYEGVCMGYGTGRRLGYACAWKGVWLEKS